MHNPGQQQMEPDGFRIELLQDGNRRCIIGKERNVAPTKNRPYCLEGELDNFELFKYYLMDSNFGLPMLGYKGVL